MLQIKPVSLKEANEYICMYHRHHSKVQGHKFSIGCFDNGRLCGVAVCGRPVSRHLDDNETIEVTRLCTDGTYNACSILYGRCARIVKEMGYKRIITYIIKEETGTSLLASGWVLDADDVGGGDWSKCERREKYKQLKLFDDEPKYPKGKKKRYKKEF